MGVGLPSHGLGRRSGWRWGLGDGCKRGLDGEGSGSEALAGAASLCRHGRVLRPGGLERKRAWVDRVTSYGGNFGIIKKLTGC